MSDKYIVKKETLNGLANAVRSITGTTEMLSLVDITSMIKNLSFGGINQEKSQIFVGMMEPYSTVGKDGDIFFLV